MIKFVFKYLQLLICHNPGLIAEEDFMRNDLIYKSNSFPLLKFNNLKFISS